MVRHNVFQTKVFEPYFPEMLEVAAESYKMCFDTMQLQDLESIWETKSSGRTVIFIIMLLEIVNIQTKSSKTAGSGKQAPCCGLFFHWIWRGWNYISQEYLKYILYFYLSDITKEIMDKMTQAADNVGADSSENVSQIRK